MYVFFVVQAVLAALHAAVAQVPTFQLVCPDLGFNESEINTVQCTVRGQDVTNAGCVSPVTLVKFETVDVVGTKLIGHSIYPTCETSWSHSGNDNGRCVTKDANDIYTYEFNVTADRAILTINTGLRCYADCTTGPGLPNPFTYNSSESCGPPVKFADHKDNGGLSPEEKKWIGGGAGVGAVGIAGGAIAYTVILVTRIYVFFSIAEEKVPELKEEIKDMKGVSFRPKTDEEKETCKEADYVIEIKLPFDQKKNKSRVENLIKTLGGRCYCPKDDPKKTTNQPV